MNTIKISALAIALLLGSMSFANSESAIDKDPSSISKEILKLLDKHELDLKEELSVQITFTVNKNHEIVVIDVDSENDELKAYVKRRLNYHKIDAVTTTGKMYFLPIQLEKR